MAVVGDLLAEPEAGWRRYDDSYASINRIGSNWINSGNTQGYNGSYYYIEKPNFGTHKFTFSFVGSRIRIIDLLHSSNRGDVKITIDGEDYIYSCKDSRATNGLFKILVFEKSNLVYGRHNVELSAISGDYFSLDAVDIDDTGYLMAFVGQQLTAPEPGWKRYDDNYPAIKYEGTYVNGVGAGAWQGYSMYTSKLGDKIKFDFIGTKIRFIGARFTNRSDSIEVYIDGVLEGTHSQLGAELAQVLQFEKTGLSNSRHIVEIINKSNVSTTHMAFDAFDIDATGRLLHPDEVLSLDDLDIGKRVRCSYGNGISGNVGVFAGLLGENKDFLPSAPTPTPLGDFYFICAEQDHLGRWVLVPDRNVQNTLSYNTLQAQGYTNGVPLVFKEKMDGCIANPKTNTNGIIVSNSIITNGIAGKSEITIEADVYCYGFTNDILSGLNTVFSCSTNGGSGNGYKMNFYVFNDRLQYGRRYGSSTATYYSSNAPFNFETNKHYHVAFTENIVSGEVKFYVDGKLIGTSVTSHGSSSFSSGIGNHVPKLLANFNDSTRVASNMEIDNVRFWSTVRTEEQIAEYYNKELTGKEENLIAYYTFDDSNSVSYSKVNGHSATIPSGLWKPSFLIQDAKQEDYSFISRLLTSGTSLSDLADSEWDKYIVNSTLNGAITTGDNYVWNWSGIYSLTFATNSSGNAIIRGNTSVSALSSVSPSATTATSTGFRPVLIVKRDPKSLIYHENSYKNYKNNQWNTVSTTLPTDKTFISEGNNLADYNRKLNTFEQLATSQVEYGIGKRFSFSIDSKTLIEIIGFNISND